MPHLIADYLRRWPPRFQWVIARPIGVALVVGTVLRLQLYYNGRFLCLDERSLQANLESRELHHLFSEFAGTQLCPAAFFAVEWAVAQVLGIGAMAMRLVPLIAGLTALTGFAALARRALPPHAAWVAVLMFAVSGDLIFYSTELKPYSTDVAAAVLAMLAGLTIAAVPVSARHYAGFAALGAVLVWFSFPVALVLAGVGASLILSAVATRDWPRATALVLTAAVWAVSFAASYMLSVQMLGTEGSRGMQAFWNFAFPPWPPTSFRDATWPLRESVRLFVNPLDYHGPLGPWVTSLPAVSLFVAGAISLGRRDRRLLAILMLPLVLTLGIAYPRLYPFHGRLVLFLVPAMLLVIAEGVGLIRRRWLRALVLISLLLLPTTRALFRFIEPDFGTLHNGVGDIRPWGEQWQRFPF